MKTRFQFPILFALACLIGGAGCQKTGSDAASASASTTTNTLAPSTTPVPPSDGAAQEPATPTPLKDALNTLFAKEAEDPKSPFPKGTHLLSVDLKEKTATVDVSKEFNELANKGESMEGAAQKKLCATLAEFPTVNTLHLTVEGKDFESQAADWRSVPVRAPKEEASSGGMQRAGSVDR